MSNSKQIIFETERLIIRSLTMDDFEDYYLLNSDEEVMRYIRPPQTREQSKERLEKIFNLYRERPGLGGWAMLLKENGNFIGSFAVIPIENSAQIQIGYALKKNEWGRGYASESVKKGLAYAFDQLNLPEIAGITYPENSLSQKVLLRNGFVFDKTFQEAGQLLHLYICKR